MALRSENRTGTSVTPADDAWADWLRDWTYSGRRALRNLLKAAGLGICLVHVS
jgi:hypothetical protein